jgi:AraC-like DNA-binding protein
LYDIFLKGTVYCLLNDYIKQSSLQEILIEKVVKEDLAAIISSQSVLLDLITESFPGISSLSSEACMSETRYKSLFKKITGLSPNVFFLNNKLSFAKEMLENGQHSVGEVAMHFNFANASHFTELFKTSFGVAPKEHLNYL